MSKFILIQMAGHDSMSGVAKMINFTSSGTYEYCNEYNNRKGLSWHQHQGGPWVHLISFYFHTNEIPAGRRVDHTKSHTSDRLHAWIAVVEALIRHRRAANQ